MSPVPPFVDRLFTRILAAFVALIALPFLMITAAHETRLHPIRFVRELLSNLRSVYGLLAVVIVTGSFAIDD